VILRHTSRSAYRCFLPDLAGFTGACCTGPGPFASLLARQKRSDNKPVGSGAPGTDRSLRWTAGSGVALRLYL